MHFMHYPSIFALSDRGPASATAAVDSPDKLRTSSNSTIASIGLRQRYGDRVERRNT
jgi:hypothetical protein